jgi:actin
VLAPEVLHRLPNGKEILLRDELFGCAEALFDPSRLGFSAPGIGDVTLDAIMRCDPDLPAGVLRELFANVVLAGGTAMLPGFAERLRTELASRAPSGTAVHVRRVPEQGTCASWAGGATLASLDAFKLMWITKSEFDAHGPSIVHSKCF